MKKQQKYLIAGLAVAAVAGVGIYLATRPPAATPAAVTPGTPAGSLTQGQVYTISATTPTSITSAQALASSLASAGWSNISVYYFNGQGSAGTLPAAPSGYVAVATWNSATAPLPTGVAAVAGDLVSTTGATALATA